MTQTYEQFWQLQAFLKENGWSSLAEAARICHLHPATVHSRMYSRGWTVEEALELEPRLRGMTAASRHLTDEDKAFLAESSSVHTMAEFARKHGRSATAVGRALAAGKSLKEAVRNPNQVKVMGMRFATKQDAQHHYLVGGGTFANWYKKKNGRGIDGLSNEEWSKAFELFVKAKHLNRKPKDPLPDPVKLWGWTYTSWTAVYEYWGYGVPQMPNPHKIFERLRKGRISPEAIFTQARQHWQIDRNLVSPDGRILNEDGTFREAGPIGEREPGYVDTFKPIGHAARMQWDAKQFGIEGSV